MLLLRRRVLFRTQCIVCLRRYASTFARPNPASSLLTSNPESSSNRSEEGNEDQEILVMERSTGKRYSVNINKIQSFEGDYSLLPLQKRLEVEQRNLFKTLRERQSMDILKKVQKDVASAKEEKDIRRIEPKQEDIDKRVRRMLRKRLALTRMTPSEEKVKRYIQHATRLEMKRLREQQQKQQAEEAKAKKKEEEDVDSQTLSFKEQWDRRQVYGTSPRGRETNSS